MFSSVGSLSRPSIPDEQQPSNSTIISECLEQSQNTSDATTGGDTINYLENLRDRARRHVMDAVGTLSMEEKQAYLDALSKAPRICEKESDPLIFLRRCDYNAEDAAKRLCFYWKERQDLFGSRALLPMTQTGNGALTAEDILSLRAGYPAILPRTTSGLQVVTVDRRQSHPRCTTDNRLRVLYYIAYIVSLEERAQTEGVIILSIITTRTGRDPDFEECQKRAIAIIFDGLPIKPLMEFVVDDASGTKRYNIQDALGVVVGYLMKHGATHDTVEVTPRRDERMLERLQQRGLRAEGIPKSLGGAWTYTNFTAWCVEQASREVEEESMMAQIEPHVQQLRNTVSKKASKEQVTTRRERNIIHSRRKRERRKLELDEMREEQTLLEKERSTLIADNKKLRESLAQAHQVIETMTYHDVD